MDNKQFFNILVELYAAKEKEKGVERNDNGEILLTDADILTETMLPQADATANYGQFNRLIIGYFMIAEQKTPAKNATLPINIISLSLRDFEKLINQYGNEKAQAVFDLKTKIQHEYSAELARIKGKREQDEKQLLQFINSL